ncbi:MAG: hypothetical protein ACI9FB_001229 [Candidatus Azotimanducaceae bacterium]|jgi:hypothetical protein
MKTELLKIEAQLNEGTYRIGQWQKLVRKLDEAPKSTREELVDSISRVSRKLHGRNGFRKVPFAPAFLLEWVIFLIAVSCLTSNNLALDITACVLLGATLQPIMKVTTGLLLGLRYDYAFLWYFEPRFKMNFGSYLSLDRFQRVFLHSMGSVGTPIALWVGYDQLYPHIGWLGWLALLGCILTSIMQVGAFAAEWLGVRSIGPFRLSQLTSPATAAFELKNNIGK